MCLPLCDHLNKFAACFDFILTGYVCIQSFHTFTSKNVARARTGSSGGGGGSSHTSMWRRSRALCERESYTHIIIFDVSSINLVSGLISVYIQIFTHIANIRATRARELQSCAAIKYLQNIKMLIVRRETKKIPILWTNRAVMDGRQVDFQPNCN